MKSVCIDLAEYEITEHKNEVRILNCRGSALGHLDNDIKKTNDNYSLEFKYGLLGDNSDVFTHIYFDGEDCVFHAYSTSEVDLSTEDVVSWVGKSLESIESVGYLTLETLETLEKILRNC
jgi:hypothetical protein